MKIALIGKSRSGKDTVAEYLVKKYGMRNYKLSYGITEIIKKYFPSDFEKGVKLREHYIKIGQTLRELNEDVWVDYTLNKINYLWGNLENLVISDVRQENEFRRLAKEGFRFIYIKCDDGIRNERIKEKGEELPSDFDNDPDKNVDYIVERYGELIEVISNNQSLERLFCEINKVVEDYESGSCDENRNNLVKYWLGDDYLQCLKVELINRIKDILCDKFSDAFCGIGLSKNYTGSLLVDIYVNDNYINRLTYLTTMLKSYNPYFYGLKVTYVLRRGVNGKWNKS